MTRTMLFSTPLMIFVFLSTASAQFSLDTICLQSDAQEILQSGVIPDTSGLLDSLTILGTCDSVTVLKKIGGLTLPLGVVKKVSSCSLHVLSPSFDSLVDVCTYVAVDQRPIFSGTVQQAGGRYNINYSRTGEMYLISYFAPSSADRLRLTIVDAAGCIIRGWTGLSGSHGSVVWHLNDSRNGVGGPGWYGIMLSGAQREVLSLTPLLVPGSVSKR